MLGLAKGILGEACSVARWEQLENSRFVEAIRSPNPQMKNGWGHGNNLFKNLDP